MSESINRGLECSPSEIYQYLRHLVEYNFSIDEGDVGEKLVPCIWGHAGMAKTSLIKQMQEYGVVVKGNRVFPVVTHIALAQLEESGDLLGLPDKAIRQMVDDSGKPLFDKKGEPMFENCTTYAKPEWWPREDGQFHILLIDDFNRASPSILKAIMQLLQDYRSNVHELPSKTTICLTGNPSDVGDYMVSEIDKAITTRMQHITIKFDRKDWATWCEQHGVDSRVISFGLKYPEIIVGEGTTRTNPRSWVQFARQIHSIKDLKSEHTALLVSQCAHGSLDPEPAAAFMKFAVGDYQLLVDPEELLKDYDKSIKKIEALGTKSKTGKPRTDLIGIMIDRLFIYLMKEGLDKTMTEKEKDNFAKFIQRNDLVAEDMIYAFLRRLRIDSNNSGDKKKDAFICSLLQRGGEKLTELLFKAV